ncbi:PREDICTED: kinetochore protein nuf2 [Tarenaya hassleriana]|uniref:kinetochore protein nuf2 n=1 Tax=Tarenaya hassleriana TaxID=28532 RepID=UPI00053CA505|nr:PREDICTED: kinetochore protein nuf2 [Tarenaya hassleriana]
MSAYEYPRYSRADIITALAESQIASVTDADLKNPSPDFISELYTHLLVHLDILNEEDMGQMDFDALEQFENPDLHVGSVQATNLYRKVKEKLDSVGCPLNFTLKDLLQPDSSRSEFFISALLNFGLHNDSKMNLIRPKFEELTLLDEQRKQWEAKIAQLNAEIAEFDESREWELPLVQELETKIEELNQTILGLNNQQVALRATFRKLKEKTTDMDKEISKAEFELVQTVQKSASLRSKIVQSPEKLQGALQERGKVCEETKNAEASSLQNYQDRAAVLEVYAKAFKKMSKSSSQLQTINEQVNNAKSIEKDFKALKAKLSDDGLMDISLEVKVVERQGRADKLNESLKQLEKEREIKFVEWTKQLNEIKLEVESKRQYLEARQKEVESVVAMVDANTAKANEVKQSREAKVQKLVSKSQEIVKQYREYTSTFGELLPSF